VQQNVTMFPVLVNLQNQEGLLKPGMNGEVSVLIDERDNVLAIPNDAVKSPREAVATGALLGLSADSVQASLRAQGFTGGGSRGGFDGGGRRNGGARNGDSGASGAAPGTGAAGSGAAATSGSAGGDVALMPVSQTGAAFQGGGFQGGQGGFGMQVSDADCKKIDDVLKAHPKEKKQIEDLRAKMQALRPAGFGGRNRGDSAFAGRNRSGDSTGQRRRGGGGFNAQGSQQAGGGGGFRGSPEMQAINEQLRAIYTQLSLDPRRAGACARRQQQSASQSASGAGSGRTPRPAPGTQPDTGQGALTPSPEYMSRPQRTRMGLVFVSDSSKTHFEPRIIQMGQNNLDYTEVVSGLKEGERVVLLGALALQAQRQQQQDRFRQNATPLGPQGPGGGGPRGGRGG